MFAIYHGPKGLRAISDRLNTIAQISERIFIDYGFQTVTQDNEFCEYFDTITIVKCDAIALTGAFLEEKININNII